MGLFLDIGWASVISVVVVIATPFLRVGLVMAGWIFERDYLFFWIGAGLLMVIAIGAVFAS